VAEELVIKFCYLLQPKEGTSVAACHRTWNMEHGYLIRDTSGCTRFARYIQNHTLDDELNDQLRASRGGPPALRGAHRSLVRSPRPREDLRRSHERGARWFHRVSRGREALHRLHALVGLGGEGDRVRDEGT